MLELFCVIARYSSSSFLTILLLAGFSQVETAKLRHSSASKPMYLALVLVVHQRIGRLLSSLQIGPQTRPLCYYTDTKMTPQDADDLLLFFSTISISFSACYAAVEVNVDLYAFISFVFAGNFVLIFYVYIMSWYDPRDSSQLDATQRFICTLRQRVRIHYYGHVKLYKNSRSIYLQHSQPTENTPLRFQYFYLPSYIASSHRAKGSTPPYLSPFNTLNPSVPLTLTPLNKCAAPFPTSPV